METHKEFNSWSDEKTFIFTSTLLAGRAAKWLRIYKKQFTQESPKTWSELKDELIQNF